MRNNLTFSVSVPVCGQAEFLKTALESVRSQSVEYELAVLDATADDSAQRVAACYEDIISYRYHHEDDGQSAAIQEGWNNTSGDIVAWLNADDYYFPYTFGEVEEVFRLNPGVDVVYGHGVHVSPDGDFIMYFPAISRDVSELTRGCVICQPSCFVRREAMERVGGLDGSLKYVMDWEFWIRLYKSGCVFHFLDKPLSAVRVYPDTKTLSGSRERFVELDGVLRANATAPERIRALAGFRYYDLLNRRNGPIEKLYFHLLRAARSLSRRRGGAAVIEGLEAWSNLVENGCRVVLPWYGEKAPDKLAVTTDRDIDIQLDSGGERQPLALESVGLVDDFGKKIKGYKHTAKLDGAGAGEKLVSARLFSTNGPWRLLSVGVER